MTEEAPEKKGNSSRVAASTPNELKKPGNSSPPETLWKKAFAGYSAFVALMGGIVGVMSQFTKTEPGLIWDTVIAAMAGLLLSVALVAVYKHRDKEIPVRLSFIVVMVVAVLAAFVGVAYASWHHMRVPVTSLGTSPSQSVTSGPSPSQSPNPTATTTTPSPSSTSKRTYTEVADNHRGIAVFSNDQGAASNVPSIPFGTSVQVLCWAPNESGMSSINAFYLITSGKWAGTYASANTFANGDPLGGAGSTAIDLAVPQCTASQEGP